MTTAIMLTVVWALPRPVDDFFVALAGGRDILAGRLGQPDNWAFTTEAHVWLNQNWGTHLLYYLVLCAFGEIGLLTLKAVMLAATAAFLVMACRQRGIGLPAALLVAGSAVAAGRSYIDLRPNLTTMMLAPLLLWMLYRTRLRPHRVWAAVLVVWLWSNMHGGFVLGLALMVLWTASRAVEAGMRERPRARSLQVVARCWPLLVGTATAVVVASLANPFGIANLTHPLFVASQPLWRTVDEWRPLFTSSPTPFGTAWEFAIVVGLWFGALFTRVRAVLASRAPHATGRRLDPDQTGLLVFDVSVAALVIAMAIQARRFVPLAALLLAPLIAMQFDALVTRGRRRWATALVAAVLLVPAALLTRPLVMRYHPDNPLYERETILQRMLVTSPFFPTKAAAFIKANGLAGPVLNAWEWEGFLRWKETGLRFFIGSRAQQAYDGTTYLDWLRILEAESSPAAQLADFEVHLAAIPMTPKYNALLTALLYADDARWVYVYCDGRHAVLADAGWDGNAELVEHAASASLRYPDEATGTLSRALCLTSPATHTAPKTAREALEAANALRPSGVAYAALGDLALSGQLSVEATIGYLEAETRRLAMMSTRGPEGGEVLEARRWIATVLASLCRTAGRAKDAARHGATVHALAAEIDSLKERWGWGDTPGFP